MLGKVERAKSKEWQNKTVCMLGMAAHVIFQLPQGKKRPGKMELGQASSCHGCNVRLLLWQRLHQMAGKLR